MVWTEHVYMFSVLIYDILRPNLSPGAATANGEIGFCLYSPSREFLIPEGDSLRLACIHSKQACNLSICSTDFSINFLTFI